MTRRVQPFLWTGHDTHAFEGGTIAAIANRAVGIFCSEPATNSGLLTRWKIALKEWRRWMRDKASPGAPVMLRLRFCYVSKAAILAVPVHVVPTENRSPA
jgi:hypothetical protein